MSTIGKNGSASNHGVKTSIGPVTQRWERLLANTRLALASIAFCLGLLTIVHVPHILLWAPSLIVSEWGHLLAVMLAFLLWARLRLRRARLASLLVVCAVVLFLSPLIRALLTAQQIPQAFEEKFGPIVPPSFPDAPARSKPLMLTDLADFSVAKLDPETFDFSKSLSLDLYRRVETHARKPVVIMVHGGYWQHGDSNQVPDINQYLAQRGYVVAAVNYRKAPAHPFPAARDDVIAAIDYLKARADELNLDPTRFVLLGRSAGGQLALVVAYTLRDPAIRGVVSLYAPTDLVWSWNNPGNPLVIDSHNLLRDYLGGSPNEKPEIYHAASPIQLAHAGAPPTLLFHGARDELIWLRQSERLTERLEEIDVKHFLVGLDWADHGFDANLWGPGGQIYLYTLERFLAAVLLAK